MKVSGTPINEPRYISVDARDLDSIRKRLFALEDDNQEIRRLLNLHMQGVKELLDEQQRLVLMGVKGALAKKEQES